MRQNKILPPQSKLQELFYYCPLTGKLTWKKQLSNKGPVGAVAGYVNDNGYLIVGIEGNEYRVHRIVWALHYSCITEDLDHIDGNKLNNRIENLRLATRSQNNWNSKLRSDNTSGMKGVSEHQGKWRVRTFLNGKEITKSGFKTKEEAITYAKQTREKEQGEFTKHY